MSWSMGRPHGHLPRQAKGCQDDTQSFHQAQALAMQAMQAMHSSYLITSHYYHWPMFQVLTHWWGLFTAPQNDNFHMQKTSTISTDVHHFLVVCLGLSMSRSAPAKGKVSRNASQEASTFWGFHLRAAFFGQEPQHSTSTPLFCMTS